MALLGLVFAAIIIIRVLVLGRDLPGYASTTVIMLFFSGLILTGLGILGEYIGRIFTEVKGRPLYVVRDTYGLADEDAGEDGE